MTCSYSTDASLVHGLQEMCGWATTPTPLCSLLGSVREKMGGGRWFITFRSELLPACAGVQGYGHWRKKMQGTLATQRSSRGTRFCTLGDPPVPVMVTGGMGFITFQGYGHWKKMQGGGTCSPHSVPSCCLQHCHLRPLEKRCREVVHAHHIPFRAVCLQHCQRHPLLHAR
jgi:hypothetical protein